MGKKGFIIDTSADLDDIIYSTTENTPTDQIKKEETKNPTPKKKINDQKPKKTTGKGSKTRQALIIEAKEKRERYNISMKPSTRDKLDLIAKENKVSASEMLEIMISNYYEK